MSRVADPQQSRPRQVSGPDPSAPRVSAPEIEHLLRRAGFGARPDELAFHGEMTLDEAVDWLGANSVQLLNGDFRKSTLNFI